MVTTSLSIRKKLVKFLNWLKYLSNEENNLMGDPKLVSLGDILLAYVSNKRTNFQVNSQLKIWLCGCLFFELIQFKCISFKYMARDVAVLLQ